MSKKEVKAADVPFTMEQIISRQTNALERIADALEKIAQVHDDVTYHGVDTQRGLKVNADVRGRY